MNYPTCEWPLNGRHLEDCIFYILCAFWSTLNFVTRITNIEGQMLCAALYRHSTQLSLYLMPLTVDGQ